MLLLAIVVPLITLLSACSSKPYTPETSITDVLIKPTPGLSMTYKLRPSGSNGSRQKRSQSFTTWGGKRRFGDESTEEQDPKRNDNLKTFTAWGGKRDQIFRTWGGKRDNVKGFGTWGGKRGENKAFNTWGGKRAEEDGYYLLSPLNGGNDSSNTLVIQPTS